MSLFDRWPSFTESELLSADGQFDLKTKGVFRLNIRAVDFLQSFRDRLGVPIIVNSMKHPRRGYRSAEENREIYKAFRQQTGDMREFVPDDNRTSFHTAGVAFDISVPGVSPGDVLSAARDFGWIGLGLYPNFVHVDLRDGQRAFWVVGKPPR